MSEEKERKKKRKKRKSEAIEWVALLDPKGLLNCDEFGGTRLNDHKRNSALITL